MTVELPRDEVTQQRLQAAKKQAANIRDFGIRGEAMVEQCDQQLAALYEKARELTGTDNLDEIRGLLVSKREDNFNKVEAFVSGIDAVETELTSLDQQFGVQR